MLRPGILALQGGFEAHCKILRSLGYKPVLVRTSGDLDEVNSLIIPGGESTVMIRLLQRYGLAGELCCRIRQGMPVFGTCAGMILLSKGVTESDQATLGMMDFRVKRNAYGRQIASFETELEWKGGKVPAVFIRAPEIVELEQGPEILLSYEDSPVLVRQENCLAASFHPELTDNAEIHRYFLSF